MSRSAKRTSQSRIGLAGLLYFALRPQRSWRASRLACRASAGGEGRERTALGAGKVFATPGRSVRRSLLVPVRALAVARIRANNRPLSIGAINLKKARVATKIGKRREWTKADLKELKDHSKARTPVVKIAKLTKRTVGALRQKALHMGIGLGHRR